MKQYQSPHKTNYICLGRFSYSEENLIGKGATGNVYKGLDLHDAKNVAIKVVNTNTMNDIQKNLIQNQKKALTMIRHENLMKVKQICSQEGFTYIISQIYEGGSLKDYLKIKGNFGQQQALQFFRKIVNGYCSVVQANIIHRDLKPANILLTNSKQPIIIDFGYSQIIIANKNLTVFNVGSPAYMSPQAFNRTIYSEKSDIWSLGVIFYQLLSTITPDEGQNIKEYFKNLEKLQFPSINFDKYGQVARQILKGSLCIKPQNRLTCHKIKYILDKQIIGKKLNQRNISKKQLNSKDFKSDSKLRDLPLDTNIKDFKNAQGKKIYNLDQLIKKVQLQNFKHQDLFRDMKKKTKNIQNLQTIPNFIKKRQSFNNLSSDIHSLKISVNQNSVNRSNQKISSGYWDDINKNITVQKYHSKANTPSISTLEFKKSNSPQHKQRNGISSINLIHKKQFHKDNVETISMNQKMEQNYGNKNCCSALTISSNNINLTKSINNEQKYRNDYIHGPLINRNLVQKTQYFNQQFRKPFKNATISEGFFNKDNRQNNCLLGNMQQQKRYNNSLVQKNLNNSNSFNKINQGTYNQVSTVYYNQTPSYTSNSQNQSHNFISQTNSSSHQRANHQAYLQQKNLSYNNNKIPKGNQNKISIKQTLKDYCLTNEFQNIIRHNQTATNFNSYNKNNDFSYNRQTLNSTKNSHQQWQNQYNNGPAQINAYSNTWSHQSFKQNNNTYHNKNSQLSVNPSYSNLHYQQPLMQNNHLMYGQNCSQNSLDFMNGSHSSGSKKIISLRKLI